VLTDFVERNQEILKRKLGECRKILLQFQRVKIESGYFVEILNPGQEA